MHNMMIHDYVVAGLAIYVLSTIAIIFAAFLMYEWIMGLSHPKRVMEPGPRYLLERTMEGKTYYVQQIGTPPRCDYVYTNDRNRAMRATEQEKNIFFRDMIAEGAIFRKVELSE